MARSYDELSIMAARFGSRLAKARGVQAGLGASAVFAGEQERRDAVPQPRRGRTKAPCDSARARQENRLRGEVMKAPDERIPREFAPTKRNRAPS